MGISYDEYRANGYKEVWGIGDKDLIRRFCNAERLLLTKVVDIDTALYDANKPEGFVIEEDLGEDRKFLAYKLGCRGFVKFLDGYSDPEVDYFIKREKEYWKRARSVGREKKRESGKYMGGVVPYGYYVLKKKLYIEEYEAFVVKFVFYRFSMGCSYGGIAKELNLRKFKNRNGNPFKAGSIKSIIENRRLYQGYFTYGGKEVKGDFTGILEDSEELLTKEWVNRVFDEATEARIAKHKEEYHRKAPAEIKPYILGEDKLEAKRKIREVKRETNRSVQ